MNQIERTKFEVLSNPIFLRENAISSLSLSLMITSLLILIRCNLMILDLSF